MGKIRSPNYPGLALGEALKAIQPAFKNENRNKMSREVLAKHVGYNSLSGPALSKIGAVRAYGLIEGTGDELRVTNDAVAALMAPADSQKRTDALKRLAVHPPLFKDLAADFETIPSEENIRFWLIQRQFTADAAEIAAKNYLDTMRLVFGEDGGYPAVVKTTAEKEPKSMERSVSAVAPRPAVPAPTTLFTPASGAEPFRLTFSQGAIELTARITAQADADDLVRAVQALKALLRPVNAATRTEGSSEDEEEA